MSTFSSRINRHGVRVRQRTSGAAIAELGAAILFLLPVLLIVCFVAIESMMVCMMKSILNASASTAARDLSIAYGVDPTGTMANPGVIFSNIRFMSVVVDNDQFSIPPGAAGWSTASNPPTVTVEVTFQGGQFGLPSFPNPDPLGLGTNFSLTSRATAMLE